MAYSPIKLLEFPKKIENVRQKFFEDESNKILSRKGMIFSIYRTDKERLVNYPN